MNNTCIDKIRMPNYASGHIPPLYRSRRFADFPHPLWW